MGTIGEGERGRGEMEGLLLGGDCGECLVVVVVG